MSSKRKDDGPWYDEARHIPKGVFDRLGDVKLPLSGYIRDLPDRRLSNESFLDELSKANMTVVPGDVIAIKPTKLIVVNGNDTVEISRMCDETLTISIRQQPANRIKINT